MITTPYRNVYKNADFLNNNYSAQEKGVTSEMKFTCPECGAEIEAEDVIEGEILTCPDCGVELEVVLEGDSYSLKPAEKEAEDWGE